MADRNHNAGLQQASSATNVNTHCNPLVARVGFNSLNLRRPYRIKVFVYNGGATMASVYDSSPITMMLKWGPTYVLLQ